MSDSKDLARQPSLSPEVFNHFINLKVGLSLSGSASYGLVDLEKVLAGEQLQKGSELVITARYFVADVHMPVTRSNTWDYQAQKYNDAYRLGDAKLDMKLIKIEKINVQSAHFEQSMAVRCECLIPNVPNTKKPAGYTVAEHPLTAYWAKTDCVCRGKGYVGPRKNKAPLAERVTPTGVIILVDELPEPPDIQEGGCEQCGDVRWHKAECPVKLEAEAKKKAELAEAKKRVKTETGKKAPECFAREYECNPYRSKCSACHALTICAGICGKDLPAPAEQAGEAQPDTDSMIHQCPHGDAREDVCPCDQEDDCLVIKEEA